MSWLPITGLALDVIGSLLFISDTNRLSGLLASMVKHIAEDHGKYDSKSFSKEEIENLQTNINKSKTLTMCGYVFFSLGFLLQLLSFWC